MPSLPQQALEGLGVTRPHAVRWLCPLLGVTFLLNSLFLIPLGLDATERFHLPTALTLVTPVASLVVGLAIVWGVRARKRWAWILAMLIFSSLCIGAVAIVTPHLPESPGLAVIGLLAAVIAWGLPAGLLYHLRDLYFPAAPEE